MRNLFSLTTNSIMKEIHAIHIGNKTNQTKTINGLWDKYIRNSMLCITEKDEKRIENANSIEEIADICIDITKPFFRFPEADYKVKYPKKENQYDILEQLSEHSITDTIKNGYDIRFFAEVKRFLVRSFIYNQSCNKRFAGIDIQDIQKVFSPLLQLKNGVKNLSNSLNNLNSNRSKFRCYLEDSAGKPNYSSSAYLDFLFDYKKAEKKNRDKKNGDKRKRYSYELSSWYDALLFIGLVHSSSPIKNPFVLNEKLKKPRKNDFNLYAFLDGFNPHPLDPKATSFFDLNDDLIDVIVRKNGILEQDINDIFISNYSFWYDISLYSIERLTNINYINRIAELQADHPQFSKIDSLYHLGAYPLTSYRLDAIERFQVLFHESSGDSWENTMKPYNDRLIYLIQHHLFIAFPQLDMLFNLSLLRNRLYFKRIQVEECKEILDDNHPLFYFTPCKKEKSKCDITFKESSSNFSEKFYLKNNDMRTISTRIKKPSNIQQNSYSIIVNSVFSKIGNYAILGDMIESQRMNIPDDVELDSIRYYTSVCMDTKTRKLKETMDKENYGKPAPFIIHP